MGDVWVEVDFVRMIQLRLRLAPALRWERAEDAVDDLLARMRQDPELALDAIDAALWSLNPSNSYYVEPLVAELNQTLEAGGSVWEAHSDGDDDRWRLRRRAARVVREAIETLAESAERAHHHLREAWRKIAGREPDATGAYREAVKAIEAAAKPVVVPDATLATLGMMIAALRDKPDKWTYPLGGSDAMRGLLERVWKGQHDRHGTDDPEAPLSVELDEARAAVHLATAICASFAEGVVARRPTE
jgi:hypothetical protein